MDSHRSPGSPSPRSTIRRAPALALFGVACLAFQVVCSAVEPGDPVGVSQAAPRPDVVMLEFRDPTTGMVQHKSPYPPGWRYDGNPNDTLLLTGPGGVEVHQTSSGRIFSSNDPFALESIRMTGAQIGPVVPLAQYLQQQYAPYMAQRGFQLTGQSDMPEIERVWELFAAGMPQGLSVKRFDAIGAEWDNGAGVRAFTILVHDIADQGTYLNWGVSASELFAPASVYESARDAHRYAAANLEVNPQWQIAKNKELLARIAADKQMLDERLRQSRIQHLQRMNAILARGQASASIAKTNSDILDISHQGYLDRSSMVSAGQAATVDMIGERSVIANPTTGEHYQVEAGSGHYWVNAQGEYLSTDNPLFDPRTDQRLSDEQWERFELVR